MRNCGVTIQCCFLLTQPGHSFAGRCNEYQPKGSDALQLGSKGRYGSCGWPVKLRDPLVTHGPYLSALEMLHDKAIYKLTFTLRYSPSPPTGSL